ncbi:MAG: NfeD family protein [Candidatus Bathyarchaeia archaeon]
MSRQSSRYRKAAAALIAVLDEIAAAVILLALLPLLGVAVPLPVVAAVLGGFAVLSFFLYRAVSRAYSRIPALESASLVGLRGTAASNLEPDGFVRLEGVFWKAKALRGSIRKDRTVVVVNVDGLTLEVTNGEAVKE